MRNGLTGLLQYVCSPPRCGTAGGRTGCCPAAVRLLSGFTLVGASVQIHFLGYVAQWVLVYSTGLLPLPSYTPPAEDPAA
ncbi:MULTISPECIES: hypothetical protein [Streptomyces]|uniref:hypothetical protein n=1 Tax=Streptomyces TaxID=1883 RepID=UPI00068A7703|nr:MULTISPECIES: hypothetical protein [Streptomyces]